MAKVPVVGGAAAIAKPVGPAPYVISKLSKGEDGTIRTIYVNPLTGEQVADPSGYTILTGGSNIPSQLDIGKVDPLTDDNTDDNSNSGKSNDDLLLKDPGGHGAMNAGPSSQHNRGNQNPMGNYGYISKESGISKAVSKALGKFGITGKAINLGWNMNNEQAAETARTALGTTQPSVRGTIGSLLSGNKGQVANSYDIGGKKYSVGFEAMSPDNKTNLTVTEALNRQNLATAQKAAQQTVQKAVEAAVADNPKALSEVGISTPSTPDTAPTPTTRPSQAISPAQAQATSPAASLDAAAPAASKSYNSYENAASGVGFTENYGPNRPNRPNASIIDSVKSAVANTFGPGYGVVGISGTEDPGGQYGSNRHKTGLAMDFDVTDPNGKKVTDVNALNDMASKFAYDQGPKAQVGFGVGYMTDENGLPGRMHLDLTDMSEKNPEHQSATWGGPQGMAQALSETVDAARAGYQPTPFSNPGVPTARPDPSTLDKSFVSQDERPTYDLDPVEHQDIVSSNAAQQSTVARGIISKAATGLGTATFGDLGLTPAQAASLGMTTRSKAQMDKMAQTIAGELSQSSLKGLQDDNPDARTEVANMMTSMENRAQSKMFDSLDSTLAPSQYNSLMDANMATTNQNYSTYKSAIDKAVDDYYSGALQPSNYDISSYYNPDVANPSWGPMMDDQTQVNQHVFGSLPEYGASSAFSDSVAPGRSFMSVDNGESYGHDHPGSSTSSSSVRGGTSTYGGGGAGYGSFGGGSGLGTTSGKGSAGSAHSGGYGTSSGSIGGGAYGGSSPGTGSTSGRGSAGAAHSGGYGTSSSTGHDSVGSAAGGSAAAGGNSNGFGGPR